MKHLLIAIVCLIIIFTVFSINYILGVVCIFIFGTIASKELDKLADENVKNRKNE